MRYNYVDIGTADFETSLDVWRPGQTVLLVEPLFYYLKKLPDGEDIYKSNLAISDKAGFGQIYYIDEPSVQQYNLPGWVRGCNSLGHKHPTVVKLLNELGLPESLIIGQSVRIITFEELAKLYDIAAIGQLKIDTEGHDHLILPSVIKLIGQGKLTADKIVCEYLTAFKNTAALDKILAKLTELGYTSSRYGDNITLTKS